MSDINGGSNSEYPSTRSISSQLSEEEPFLFTLDLVSAAKRNLKFLRYVDDSHWLHHSPTLIEAIRRFLIILFFFSYSILFVFTTQNPF